MTKTAFDIIKNPYLTEKSVNLIDQQNTLVFIVDARATKSDVKRAVEEAFDIGVEKVNTQNTFKGHKKAYVKLTDEHDALDVATQLGML